MDYELEWYLVTKSRIVWTLALGGCFFCLFFCFTLSKYAARRSIVSRPRAPRLPRRAVVVRGARSGARSSVLRARRRARARPSRASEREGAVVQGDGRVSQDPLSPVR